MSGGLVKDEGTKIFRSGNLMRINLEKEYRLTDLENSTTWVVRPAKCTHVPGPDGRSYPFSAYRNFKMERVAPDEKETLDGHPTTVVSIGLTPEGGPRPIATLKVWRADDLNGFPIKTEAVHRARTITVNYADVSLDTPDAALFKVPKSCPDFSAGEAKPAKQSPAKAAKPAPKISKPQTQTPPK